MVAFLSYRYVLQIFVFVHAIEFIVQLLETPDTIYMVVFVRGNILKLLRINILWFLGHSASYNTAWLNKHFSLNESLYFRCLQSNRQKHSSEAICLGAN
jgi:hypothetical protein